MSTTEFSGAEEVRAHLRSLPEVTVTDPGGNTIHARVCPHCGAMLRGVVEDDTYFIDDVAVLLGQTPAPPTDSGCRCGELLGAEFPVTDSFDPHPGI